MRPVLGDQVSLRAPIAGDDLAIGIFVPGAATKPSNSSPRSRPRTVRGGQSERGGDRSSSSGRLPPGVPQRRGSFSNAPVDHATLVAFGDLMLMGRVPRWTAITAWPDVLRPRGC